MKSQATKTRLSLLLLAVLVLLGILSYNKAYFFLWLTVTFLGWYLAAFVAILIVLWFTKPVIYNVFVSLSILVASILCGIVIFQRDVRSYIEQWAVWKLDNEQENDALGIGVFSGGDETRMARAIAQNDVVQVRKLIDDGINIQAKGEDGEGFLEFTLSQRARQKDYIISPELLKELLDAGINPNPASDPYGLNNTIEYWRNFNPDNPAILEMLLKAGASIPDSWYRSSPEDLRIFFRHGAKINEPTVKGYDLGEYVTQSHESNNNYVTGQWTPLMHLIDAAFWEQAICLIDLGADLTYTDENKISLEKIVAKQGVSYYDHPQFQRLVERLHSKK